jgi:hypothetical protein
MIYIYMTELLGTFIKTILNKHEYDYTNNIFN